MALTSTRTTGINKINEINFPCVGKLTNSLFVTPAPYYLYGNCMLEAAQKSPVFSRLYQIGFCIWLDLNGNIYYKLSGDDKKMTASIPKIEMLISTLLRVPITIVTNTNVIENQNRQLVKPNKIDNNKPPFDQNGFLTVPMQDLYAYQLNTIELPIVHSKYLFNPYSGSEFLKQQNGVFFINSFKPTAFLDPITTTPFQTSLSITLQYLYYLADYKNDKLEAILHFITSIFCSIVNQVLPLQSFLYTLILIGDKNSGKDILFDVIIKELFGSKYCLEINDATLNKDITKDVPDKIFYCFNNISSDSIQDKQTKNLVEKIINDDMIELKNHDNFYFVGGRLITSEANNLPYKVLGEYKAFKINKNLEEDFRFLDPMTKVMRKYTRSELIKAIRLDLFNFSCEIRNFAPSINLAQVKNDIDINHTPSLQEDIEKFANEVADKQGEYLEKHILPFLENNYPDNFNDIKQLFEKHKMIERKYIRDFFMKKYNHIVSAKELYKELLASNNCYAKVTAPGGKKCFLFNK